MTWPKSQGGLGFRDFRIFNQVLLTRQAWRLLIFPDNLCARLLKAKHYPSGRLEDTVFSGNPSQSWHGVCHVLELLKKGLVWLLMRLVALYSLPRAGHRMDTGMFRIWFGHVQYHWKSYPLSGEQLQIRLQLGWIKSADRWRCMVLALFAEERMKTSFMCYMSVTTPGVYGRPCQRSRNCRT